jgi:branched-chain amino acid transport system ATP-binding protein
MSDAILEVRNLTRTFGGLTAVNKLSFSVTPGTIHGLIGPNGAGKTTTFNVISGFYAPSSGEVIYQGQDVSGMTTASLARIGLIRTFQGTTLFKEFSVLDNVKIGFHGSVRSTLIGQVLGTDREESAKIEKQADELIDFFDLTELRNELASNLSHGHQRALGMAVALAAQPKIILLDEPFTGMNPEETSRMMTLVRSVRDRAVTIMLVEHDMHAIMGLCEKITVMNFGSLLTEGTPQQVRTNPKVIEAYLGSAIDAA